MERKEKVENRSKDKSELLVDAAGYVIGIAFLVITSVCFLNFMKARDVKAEEVQQETQQTLSEELVLTAGSETQLNMSQTLGSKEIVVSNANLAETEPIVSISENHVAIDETDGVEVEVQTEECVSGNELEELESTEIKTTRKIVMYEEASTDSKKIRTLKAGATLTNVEEAGEGWLKVTYNDTDGYVYYLYTDYLDEVEKVILEKRRFAEFTPGVVSGNGVNIRALPGTTSEVIACVRKGTEVEVLSMNEMLDGEEHGWYRVRIKATNQYGFIYGQYLYIGSKLPEEVKVQQNNNFVQVNYNESDEMLLAKAITIEAGNCGIREKGFSGQVLCNRANINGTDIRTELAKPNQYPTTWRRIQNEQIEVTPETLELAGQILRGEVNCFAGTPLESLGNQVYFQDKAIHGYNNWFSGVHWYGTKAI